jgi:hypothetical protein
MYMSTAARLNVRNTEKKMLKYYDDTPVVAEVRFQRVGRQLYGEGRLVHAAQHGAPRPYEPNFEGDVYGPYAAPVLALTTRWPARCRPLGQCYPDDPPSAAAKPAWPLSS